MKRITNEQVATLILPREQAVEAALSWAAQQSYSFSGDALTSYCALRNLEWTSDPMYGYITFIESEQYDDDGLAVIS